MEKQEEGRISPSEANETHRLRQFSLSINDYNANPSTHTLSCANLLKFAQD
jgi:hypothetical protein